MIRALAEELKPLATNPGQFLSKLNSDLHAILKHAGTPMLTTAFYLVADWKTGAMRYANAGHPKPLHIRRGAGQVEPLANAGGKSQPVLGLFEDAAYQTSEVTLSPKDMVMLFTDGLYEVQDRKNELYSQAMLVAGVQRRAELPAPRLFDELLEEIKRFSADAGFADDVCLVGIEYAGRAGKLRSHRQRTCQPRTQSEALIVQAAWAGAPACCRLRPSAKCKPPKCQCFRPESSAGCAGALGSRMCLPCVFLRTRPVRNKFRKKVFTATWSGIDCP